LKTNKKNILILEPSEIIRQGLTAILTQKNATFLVKETVTESELSTTIHTINPFILVLSPRIYNNNIKLIQALKAQKGLLVVGIVFNVHHPDALQHFDGLIYLNDRPETILSTISNLLTEPVSNQNPSSNDTLSERETEVLKLMVSGFSTKKIADTLFISTHTVNAHRKNIMRKLDIKTISGLTIYAVLNNIINLKKV